MLCSLQASQIYTAMYLRGVVLYLIKDIFNEKFKKKLLRPDLLISVSDEWLYILELTVGFESNLRTNAERKAQKYRDLVLQQGTVHILCQQPRGEGVWKI